MRRSMLLVVALCAVLAATCASASATSAFAGIGSEGWFYGGDASLNGHLALFGSYQSFASLTAAGDSTAFNLQASVVRGGVRYYVADSDRLGVYVSAEAGSASSVSTVPPVAMFGLGGGGQLRLFGPLALEGGGSFDVAVLHDAVGHYASGFVGVGAAF